MAEVYSLGCTIWILLAQIDLDDYDDDGGGGYDVRADIMKWTAEGNDLFGIPQS